MIALTGDHKTLYDLLQAKAKANLERASGVPLGTLGDLGDNDTLARDIGSLPLDSVTELLKRHQSPGIFW